MIDVLPDTGVEKETGKRFFPSKRKSRHCERTEGMSTINSLWFPHANDRSSSMPFYNIRNFLSFRQGFALVTKNKWQLVYLAGRTVRCLASMYDKPFQKILCFYHSGNVTHARKYSHVQHGRQHYRTDDGEEYPGPNLHDSMSRLG